MTAVTIHSVFGAQENKVCQHFHLFPFYWPEEMGLDAMILVFFNVEFQTSFFIPLFTLIRDSLVPLHCLPLEWYCLDI